MRLLLFQILLAALAWFCAAKARRLQSPPGKSEFLANQESLQPTDPMIHSPDFEDDPSMLIGNLMIDFFSFMDSMKLENLNIPPEESNAILVDYLVAQGIGTVDEITAVLEAQRISMAEYEAGMTPAERARWGCLDKAKEGAENMCAERYMKD